MDMRKTLDHKCIGKKFKMKKYCLAIVSLLILVGSQLIASAPSSPSQRASYLESWISSEAWKEWYYGEPQPHTSSEPASKAQHIPEVVDGMLDLTAMNLGDVGAEELAKRFQANTIKGIDELDLAYNNISFVGITALAPHLPAGLIQLNLSANDIGDKGLMALVEQPLPENLLALWLGFNNIGDAAIAAFVPHIPKSLIHLDLNGNEVGNSARLALKKQGFEDVGDNQWRHVVPVAEPEDINLDESESTFEESYNQLPIKKRVVPSTKHSEPEGINLSELDEVGN